MKKVILIIMIPVSLFFLGCNSRQNATSTEDSAYSLINQQNLLTVNDVLIKAPNNIDKEVLITGVVTHVCKHAGKRCFLSDSDGKVSMRVEATGNIGGFNMELKGNHIVVKGIIKEKRLDGEFITEWEAKTKKEIEVAEKEGRHCSAELSNIQKMKEWMVANNKSFYSVYYIEGLDYEIVY